MLGWSYKGNSNPLNILAWFLNNPKAVKIRVGLSFSKVIQTHKFFSLLTFLSCLYCCDLNRAFYLKPWVSEVLDCSWCFKGTYYFKFIKSLLNNKLLAIDYCFK